MQDRMVDSIFSMLNLSLDDLIKRLASILFLPLVSVRSCYVIVDSAILILLICKVVPKVFMNKNLPPLHCEARELAKHHRAIFSPQSYEKSAQFTMIHSDVWVPFKIKTLSNKCWFITFIDDHSRMTWVFLSKINLMLPISSKTFTP